MDAKCSTCGVPLNCYGLCPRCLMAVLEPLPESSLESFGNFEPVTMLGEGGMGVVYLAEQIAPLRRAVALKVLKADSASAAITERFDRERQSLASLAHPNIAAIFEAGTSAHGLPYFAMEYIEGSSITAYCDSRRLTLAERVRLLLQACDAVEYSHRRGILHRDLKPSNILITEQDGRPLVKVIDFGLSAPQQWHTFGRRQLTGVAQILGTPEYMSPEQAGAAEGVDQRTDIYSLGIVLFEILVGALPFDADAWGSRSASDILRLIVDTELPSPAARFSRLGTERAAIAGARATNPAALYRELRGDLKTIIRKATEKDPARRYASAADLAADLNRYLRHEPVESRRGDRLYRLRQGARRHRWALQLGAAAALPLATAAVIWVAARPPAPMEVEELVPLTALEGYETSPTFAPDGKTVAFTWAGPAGDNYDLYTVHEPGQVPQRLTTDPADDVSPAWSPDGRFIAFLRGIRPVFSRLMLLEVDSGQEKELVTLTAWYGHEERNLSWSPDGNWIAVLDDDRHTKRSLLRLFSPHTGEFREVYSAAENTVALAPAFSVDGRYLAFTQAGDRYRLLVQRLDTAYNPVGEPVVAFDGYGKRAVFPAWTPHGDLLFSVAEMEKARLWWWSSHRRETHPLEHFGDFVIDVAVARGYPRIAIARRAWNVDIWRYRLGPNRRPLSGPQALAPSNSFESAPDISPDGKEVVFYSTRSGKQQIWLAHMDGSGLRQLTFAGPGQEVRGLHWVPGGTTIRFVVEDGTNFKPFVANARTGQIRDDVPLPAGAFRQRFSNDGRWRLLTKPDTSTLFRVPADDSSPPVPVAGGVTYHPRYDPQGEWVYFVDHLSGDSVLSRVRVLGGQEEVLARDVLAGCVAISRSGFYFVRRLALNRYGIYYEAHRDRKPQLLFEVAQRPYLNMAVSADDRDLLLQVSVQEGSDILIGDVVHW